MDVATPSGGRTGDFLDARVCGLPPARAAAFAVEKRATLSGRLDRNPFGRPLFKKRSRFSLSASAGLVSSVTCLHDAPAAVPRASTNKSRAANSARTGDRRALPVPIGHAGNPMRIDVGAQTRSSVCFVFLFLRDFRFTHCNHVRVPIETSGIRIVFNVFIV